MILDSIFWNRAVNTMTLIGTVLVIAPTTWVLLQPRPSQVADDPEKQIENKHG
jgi:hypothetical protein